MQAPAKERPGKAGLRDGALLSCSASPSLAANQHKILPLWKTAGWGSAKPKSHFGFTVGGHQGLEKLPQYILRAVRTGAIKQPKVTREKAAFAQGFAVCARLCSVLIPHSTSPQTGGTPDSLPITVISHPYTWLRSVEKETSLIFQYFMARYFCWQSELQIFLRGPFAPYVFVFSAPLPATTHAGSPRGCRRDTGHWGNSIPHHVALLKHFVPIHGDRQTLPSFKQGWLWAVPRAKPLSKGLAWQLPMGAGVGEKQEDKILPQGRGRGEENTCSNAFDPVQTPSWKSIAAQFV